MGNTLFLNNDWVGGIGKLSVSPNGRYLVDDFINPIFIVGDAGWCLFTQISLADAYTYLEARAAAGFNLILVELIERGFSDNKPNNAANDAPFTGANFTTPNEDYFAHVDAVIDKAATLGLYVMLSPLYLGFATTDEGWNDEVDAASTADMTAWGEFCGARWATYSNILWVMGGDRDPTAYMTKINAFMTGLLTYVPNAIVTTHTDPNKVAHDETGSEDWFNLNCSYANYANASTLAQTAYSDGLPFILFEGYYENEHSMTAQALRAQAYWTVLEGGIGHIYGNCPVWHFNATAGESFCDGAANWEDVLTSTGAVSMTHFGGLFNSLAWETLVPDSTDTVLTSGNGTIGEADYAPCAINAAGTLAIIYMPSNRTMTVDMSEFAGTVTARWYDPEDGSYTADAASPVANSGTHNFSRATSNSGGDADWVLVLEA